MSDDTPTPYELLRAVEALRKDMRTGFGEINRRLDGMVTGEVLELTRQGFDHRVSETEKDITALDEARKTDAKDRAADRRWRIGLVVTSATAIVIMFVSIVVDLSRAAS